MGSPYHNYTFNSNDIDTSQQIYATKLSNVQRDLHGCHGPACPVQADVV